MMRVALLMVLLLPLMASAHGLVIEASLIVPDEGATVVRATVYFDDDTPLIAGRVRILDSAGAVVSEATTNDKGIAELPRPIEAGLYKIVADDGGSHAASTRLVISNGKVELDPPPENDKELLTAAGLGIISLLAGLPWLILKKNRKR